MDRVYIVTSGYYSDYMICAAFSTLEKAQEYMDKDKDEEHGDGSAQIEIYLLDCEKPVSITNVQMLKDGTVLETETKESDSRLDIGLYNYYAVKPGKYDEMYISWNVETDSVERAIKIVNEKRAQILAANAWGDNNKTEELFTTSKNRAERLK